MARLVKPLTATQVANAKAKANMYKMFDGGGLFLQVNPSGGKHWKMKYRKNDGKEGLLTFGSYPAVTLEQARKMRDEAKSQKAVGVDPGVARREEKAERMTMAKNTFEAVTREWMEVHATKVKPQTLHIYKVLLEKSVFPLIGKMPIREMKAPDFLEMLRRLESQRQLYSVKRISIVCGLIMRFAVATGRADADPMPSLRGSLKAHKTKHLASTTDPKQVGRLLRTIDAYQGSFVVSCALKIAPYVFVRPGELQHARWEDIDFEACEWRYTTSKTNTPHIVPLAPQVMKILKDLHDLTGHQEWVFPSMRQRGEPMGKTTILAALRAMGITDEEMTPHGFRAMARTLLDEVLGERYDLIEHQLAHMVRDPNGRAYNRTVHLVERKRMMERWANYLDELRADVAVIA
ncbi:integrase arm-type DNA-binding domain-containing protein [Desulfovibrio sp. OttesenSCG-928-M14]|nr:integrase arm-type DNA-binding domain-containing protein [Desulfovibrio sp. OttesenSCG-928-M14]